MSIYNVIRGLRARKITGSDFSWHIRSGDYNLGIVRFTRNLERGGWNYSITGGANPYEGIEERYSIGSAFAQQRHDTDKASQPTADTAKSAMAMAIRAGEITT